RQMYDAWQKANPGSHAATPASFGEQPPYGGNSRWNPDTQQWEYESSVPGWEKALDMGIGGALTVGIASALGGDDAATTAAARASKLLNPVVSQAGNGNTAGGANTVATDQAGGVTKALALLGGLLGGRALLGNGSQNVPPQLSQLLQMSV